MKTIVTMAAMLFILASCTKERESIIPDSLNPVSVQRITTGQMDVFAQHERRLVAYVRFTGGDATAAAEQTTETHVLYTYPLYNHVDHQFLPSTDAVQPVLPTAVWKEMRIRFRTGVHPFQITSSEQVELMASQPDPMITVTFTGKVFRLGPSASTIASGTDVK